MARAKSTKRGYTTKPGFKPMRENRRKLKEGGGAGVKFTFLDVSFNDKFLLTATKSSSGGWVLPDVDELDKRVRCDVELELESYMDRKEVKTSTEVRVNVISDELEYILNDLERYYEFDSGDTITFNLTGYIEGDDLTYMYGRGYSRFDAPDSLRFYDGDYEIYAEVEIVDPDNMNEDYFLQVELLVTINDEIKAAYNSLDSFDEDDEFMDESSNRNSKLTQKNHRKTDNEELIEIPEEVRIPGTDVILEAGDMIRVLSEMSPGQVRALEQKVIPAIKKSIETGDMVTVSLGHLPDRNSVKSTVVDALSWGNFDRAYRADLGIDAIYRKPDIIVDSKPSGMPGFSLLFTK